MGPINQEETAFFMPTSDPQAQPDGAPTEGPISRLIRLLTGARGPEQRQVLCCFVALLFLLLSYYLVKPLRNSQFLKQFDPTFQPVLSLFVPILSLMVTKVFNYFCDRVHKYRLIVYVYLLIIGCQVGFTWFLPYGGRAATVIFYYWATVYFLLAMATLWACFNDFFTSEQGERCFGFVAMGATVGNIVGAQISSWMTSSPYKGYALLAAAAFQGLALLFLMLATAMRQARTAPEPAPDPQAQAKVRPKAKFWSDVTGLFRIPYVRGIAIMVTCLATFTTSLDFLSNKAIDIQLSKKQYLATFAELNRNLNLEQGLPAEQLNSAGYDFIYGLKSASKGDEKLHEFARAHKIHPSDLEALYQKYQDDLEGKTRKLFSDVYLYQGVVGVITLTLVARVVFATLGLPVAVLIMPTFALIAVVAFAFPMELLTVEAILILSGALNYALNNATKEILYTATSEETKFKHKPLIEGPFMRLGDVGASIMNITILGLAAQAGLAEAWRDRLFLIFTFVLTLIWWRSIGRSGRIYQQMREG